MIKRAMLITILVIFPVPALYSQVWSDFETDDEGWYVQDVDCYTSYWTAYTTVSVTWQATGGDPGAHVTHHDVTNYCSFFSAPAAYLGDKSAYLGGRLEFSLFTTESDWQEEDVVVLIGAGLVVCHELPVWPPQPPDWHHYVVSLASDQFTYDDENGATVSAVDFEAVLTDLQSMLIPAEFGAEVEETDGLDSVLLVMPGSPVPGGVAVGTRLHDAYPNPFNPRTTIRFHLAKEQAVRLCVYDVAGRLVDALLDNETAAGGRNEVVWRATDLDGRTVPAGVYFYHLDVGGYSETKRMILVK